MAKHVVIFVGISLLAGVPCSAATITVDPNGSADYTTIQAAIDAANPNDTVLVADGIYTGASNRDIDFLGKAITVKSANGPENCSIDPNGKADDPHRAFYFHNYEDANSVLDGFTLTNGFASGEYDKGGAVLCEFSSPTIMNCIITDNESAGDGGGIGCNHVCGPMIVNCTIVGNRTDQRGGGIAYLDGSSGEIVNCRIMDNNASLYGGGVSFAFYCGGTKISNCVIADNSAGVHGGGLYYWVSIGRISNCTITGNNAHAGQGGGIHFKYGIDYAKVHIGNSILWGNTALTTGLGPEISVDGTWELGPITVEVSYSNVQGGQEMVYREGDYATLIWAVGNIDADPIFVDPDNDDYHLKSQVGRWDPNTESWVIDPDHSPGIDAGDPCSVYSAELWSRGHRVNMGAYGNTPEASRSCTNIDDLRLMGGDWLQADSVADIIPYPDGDGIVDLRDYAFLALHWLCQE